MFGLRKNTIPWFHSVAFLAICFIWMMFLRVGSTLIGIDPIDESVYPFPVSMENYTQNVRIKSFQNFDNIDAPESIAIYQDRMVTGSGDGHIYEIKPIDRDNYEFIPLVKVIDDGLKKIKIASANRTQTNQRRFSRPLGIKFDSKGNLLVTEPWYGIIRIKNIFIKPQSELIFDIDQTEQLDGGRSKMIDDLAFEEKSNDSYIIYMTDSSSRFDLEHLLALLGSSDFTGRLIRYDTETKKLDSLMNNIHFPNGIEISADNSFLLFSEFQTRTVWKYHLKGVKTGVAEKILTNLPAEVDNIRLNRAKNGQTFWLGMMKPRIQGKQTLHDLFNRWPSIRLGLFIITNSIANLIDWINSFLSISYLNELAIYFRALKFAKVVLNEFFHGGMLLEIDANSNIVTSVYDFDDTNLNFASEVAEIESDSDSERTLLLGSFMRSAIRKLIITRDN